MKCANCNDDALYVYRITLEKAIYYCKKDLPKFLNERRRAGFLNIPSEPRAKSVEVPTSPVVEEPAVEEQVAEEPTVETPKPKKKAAKKKAE
jgi:hypothetical protein